MFCNQRGNRNSTLYHFNGSNTAEEVLVIEEFETRHRGHELILVEEESEVTGE